MAELFVSDHSVHHISVPDAELDVVNGRVDLSDVDEDVRPKVEADVQLALLRLEAAAVSVDEPAAPADVDLYNDADPADDLAEEND